MKSKIEDKGQRELKVGDHVMVKRGFYTGFKGTITRVFASGNVFGVRVDCGDHDMQKIYHIVEITEEKRWSVPVVLSVFASDEYEAKRKITEIMIKAGIGVKEIGS